MRTHEGETIEALLALLQGDTQKRGCAKAMAKEITTLDSVKAKSLRDTSFTEAEDTVKQRLIVAIDGETGSGKNRLAFSFPSPIAFMSFDPNYAKALTEARKAGAKVQIAKYSIPVVKPDGKLAETVASVCGETWDQFAIDYMGALRDPKVRTVVIDTATELFELVTYAIYGKNVMVMPKDRGHAYAAYRQVIREAENTDKNLVLLHKMKDEWKADKSTGNRIRAGYKDTAYSVVMELLMLKEPTEPFPDRYHCRIQKCHLRPEIEWDGEGNGELVGDMIQFETLQAMVWE